MCQRLVQLPNRTGSNRNQMSQNVCFRLRHFEFFRFRQEDGDPVRSPVNVGDQNEWHMNRRIYEPQHSFQEGGRSAGRSRN